MRPTTIDHAVFCKASRSWKVLALALMVSTAAWAQAIVYAGNSPGVLFHNTGYPTGAGWATDVNQPGWRHLTYGPYSTLPAGNYVAKIRLRVDNNSADLARVATLDVFDSSHARPLALKEVSRTDFEAAWAWQDFALPFTVSGSTGTLEFRVFSYGYTYLEHLQTEVVGVGGAPLQASAPSTADSFLIQKVCVTPSGQVLSVDPYECPAGNVLRSLRVGETAPYHLSEWYRISRNENYPVADLTGGSFIVSSWTSLRKTVLGRDPNTYDPSSDAFDVYKVENGFASAAETRDPGGFDTHFFGAHCAHSNGWNFFPVSLLSSGLPVSPTSGEIVAPISGRYWKQDGLPWGTCPDLDSSYHDSLATWSYQPLAQLGGDPTRPGGIATKYMPAIVAINGYTSGSEFLTNGHLEVFYFTQLYGRSRWELWYPMGQLSNDKKAMRPEDTGGCIGPTTQVYQGIKFYKSGCVDFTVYNADPPSTPRPQLPLASVNLLKNGSFSGNESVVTYLATDTSLSHADGYAQGTGWGTDVNHPIDRAITFGPYTTRFSGAPFVARFFLDVDNNSADNTRVATIDVADATRGTVLASADLTRRQFNAPGQGTAFDLSFSAPAGDALEFRVFYRGNTYLKHVKTELIPGELAFRPLATYFGNGPSSFHDVGYPQATAWAADVNGPANRFMTWGPYATQFASGAYVARFVLDVDNNSADNLTIASLEVYDAAHSRVLASKDVTRRQMATPGASTAFDVGFSTTAGDRLEFRVYYRGNTFLKHLRTEVLDATIINGVAASSSSSDLMGWHRVGGAADTGAPINWLVQRSPLALDRQYAPLGGVKYLATNCGGTCSETQAIFQDIPIDRFQNGASYTYGASVRSVLGGGTFKVSITQVDATGTAVRPTQSQAGNAASSVVRDRFGAEVSGVGSTVISMYDYKFDGASNGGSYVNSAVFIAGSATLTIDPRTTAIRFALVPVTSNNTFQVIDAWVLKAQ